MTSIRYKIILQLMRLLGMKNMCMLPREEFLKNIKSINQKRKFFMPRKKGYVIGDRLIMEHYHCLTIQRNAQPSKRALLFLYGGGMLISPDKNDVNSALKMSVLADCDVWFPYYPLCIDHGIDVLHEMILQCYREMTTVYQPEQISVLGFSSGGALAIGLALHNNALGKIIAMPRQIIAVSPGSVPATEEEKKRMNELNSVDMLVDVKFIEHVEYFMRHGKTMPEYMISGHRGDFAGLSPLHFYYGACEILSALAPSFEKVCQENNVSYTMHIAPGMCHCYAAIGYFPEGKAAFNEIAERLKFPE
ncbi:alpha/beta hydrolase [Treponema phagedenis]|uniref:alpha/beta hydrolase n=1 Tax=Treponema phagedenis TaxID=162 RepID=UPI0021CCBEC2|nr:alpha/beta hydrolase [Treponema phagedenis]